MSIGIGPDDDEEWEPTAGRESASDYNGLFSWAGESHPFIICLALGLLGEMSLMVAVAGYAIRGAESEHKLSDDNHIRQIAMEPAYAMGGLAIGYLINRMARIGPVVQGLIGQVV